MSKWEKALKSGSINDKIEAITELKDVYADFLDLDPSMISASFAENTANLELLKKALNGTGKEAEDAY